MQKDASIIYDSSAIRFQSIHELKEVFRYRFLLGNLVSRDLKVRYKRSSIGFIWVMLNPLLMMTVQTIVFSNLFKFGIPHFPAYLLAGTLVWGIFAQGTNAAMANIQGNGPILRKLYVPPTIFVLSAMGSALINLAFSLPPLLLVALVTGVTPSISWLLIIPFIMIATIFSLGIGFILGAMIVFFTDTFEIYQVINQVYYFLTPIFYPFSLLRGPLRVIEAYNPMYIYIEGIREALGVHIVLDPILSLPTLGYGVGIAFASLIVGWLFFTRLEAKFAYQF